MNKLILLLMITTALLATSQQEIPQAASGAAWSVKKIAVEMDGTTVRSVPSPLTVLNAGPPAAAYPSTPFSDIFVVASPQAKPKRLTEGGSPAWSPDGSKIAYCIRAGFGFGQIQVMNADGSGHRQLTKLKGGACLPDWSPDGQRLAFTGYGTKPPKSWSWTKMGGT